MLLEVTMVAVGKLLDTRNCNPSTNIAKVSFDNCYLTEDEETMVVYMEKLMERISMSINKNTCLEVIDAIISYRITGNDIYKVSIKILYDLELGNKCF